MSGATILVDNLDRYDKQANRERGLYDVEVKCPDCGRVMMLFVARDDRRDGWSPFETTQRNPTIQGRRTGRTTERGGGLNLTFVCHRRCGFSRSAQRSSLFDMLDRAHTLGQHTAFLT